MRRLILGAALAALSLSPALANEESDGVPVAPVSTPAPLWDFGRLPNAHEQCTLDDRGYRTCSTPRRNLWGLGLAQAADCGTTALGLALGVAVEANPVAILLGGKSLPLCLLRQAALHAYARSHPDFATNATKSETAAAISNAAVLLK